MPQKIDRNVGVQSRAPTPLEVVPEDVQLRLSNKHLLTAAPAYSRGPRG